MKTIQSGHGKLLGVDFGDKRTGLSVSDDGRHIASGIGQISVGGIRKTAEAVAAVAVERQVSGIIIGLPINMDGSHGPRAERAEKFASLVRESLAASGRADLPVALFDERMTTMAAARYLNETDTRGAKRKGVIDTLSAEIILQNALDQLQFRKQQEADRSGTSLSDPDTPENAEEIHP